MIRERIALPSEYSWPHAMTYLARRQGDPIDVVEGRTFRRVLLAGGVPVLVIVQPSDVPQSPDGCETTHALEVTYVPGARAEAGHVADVREQLQRMLGLRLPLAPFYAAVSEDGPLTDIIRRHHGLPVMGSATPFDALVWAITGQQITLSFAYVLRQRLSERYGASLEWQGQKYLSLPSAEALASADADELGRMQYSRVKARAIVEVARLVAEGRLDFDALADMAAGREGLEEAIAKLCAIRGLGRWTAEYVLMRGMALPDVLPAADVGLREAVRRAYGLAERPSEQETREIGRRWTGYRSFATFYLWASLNAPKSGED